MKVIKMRGDTKAGKQDTIDRSTVGVIRTIVNHSNALPRGIVEVFRNRLHYFY